MKNYVGTKIIAAEEMSRGWLPKKQFEEDYRETDNMTFGLALEALKKGKKVARMGWNGKGMYLFLAAGEDLTNCLSKGDMPQCVDSICMKTAQNTIVIGWLASQTDMLAEDWILVE